MLTLTDHCVNEARQLPSPNAEARPDPDDISLIIVHNISLPPGRFGGPHIDQLFTNCLDPEADPFFREICDMRVSSHFLIRRGGELVQYVPCDRRAWHAGRSSWDGRTDCNDFAIGIELEGADDVPYTEEQYRILVQLIALLQASYPRLKPDAVVGHEDVAPGRKTDPGPAFDWRRLRRALAAVTQAAQTNRE